MTSDALLNVQTGLGRRDRPIRDADALVRFVRPEEHSGDQTYAGEPYHLADGMDLRR